MCNAELKVTSGAEKFFRNSGLSKRVSHTQLRPPPNACKVSFQATSVSQSEFADSIPEESTPNCTTAQLLRIDLLSSRF